MDKLQEKIAEIIDREVDGLWEPLKVADVLIRELKLTKKFDGYNLAASRYTTGWFYG